MDINCPHFSSCSCCTVNTNVTDIPSANDAKQFFAAKGCTFALHAGAPCGWRSRAKLAVRGTSLHPIIGLYEKGTHHAVDIPQCRVHHPKINEAANILRQWIVETKIEPYDEIHHRGLLRYVQLGVDRATGQIQLVLVIDPTSTGANKIVEHIASLWEKHRSLWHSVWVNENARRDNVIFGSAWNLLHGERWLWEQYGSVRVCIHPASFVQANPEMFEQLLAKLGSYVPPGSNVVEYYAGGGVIGLSLVSKCKKVVCNEVVPLALTSFEETLHTLSPELQPKISFVLGPAEKHAELLQGDAEVVIVDPPRKGVDETLLKRIDEAPNVKRLIYVSCGWPSFKRDCEWLLRAGWILNAAQGYLFFPGTDHIEVLAIFDRQ
jgi:tRNA/tmRNA/rRNA uracil-C5-methylase (TrmA/RlmC/RlmD family)